MVGSVSAQVPETFRWLQTREQCKTLQARAEAAEKQTQALEDVRSKALVLARQNGTLQAWQWPLFSAPCMHCVLLQHQSTGASAALWMPELMYDSGVDSMPTTTKLQHASEHTSLHGRAMCWLPLCSSCQLYAQCCILHAHHHCTSRKPLAWFRPQSRVVLLCKQKVFLKQPGTFRPATPAYGDSSRQHVVKLEQLGS